MGQNINLLEALPKPTIVVFQTNLVFQILAGWLGLLMLIYALGFLNLMLKEKDLAKLEQTKQTLNTQITEATKIFDQLNQTAPSAAVTTPTTNASQMRGFSAYLEDLAKYTPNNIWYEFITFLEPGGKVVLQGTALSPALIPNLISSLGNSQALKEKKFGTLQLQKIEKENAIKFSLGTETISVAPPIKAPTTDKPEYKT